MNVVIQTVYKKNNMKVEDLKIYKDSLYSSLSRDLDAFEKNFILISSGMLAFSITFIKDIVKINESIYLPLLFLGWLLILLAVGLMMFTFLSSVNGSNSLWKIVDDYIVQNKLYDKTRDLTPSQDEFIKEATNEELYRIKNRLKTLRKAAIWCFLFGVLFFGSFVSINIYRENESKNKTTRNEFAIKMEQKVIITNDSIVITKPKPNIKTKKIIKNKK